MSLCVEEWTTCGLHFQDFEHRQTNARAGTLYCLAVLLSFWWWSSIWSLWRVCNAKPFKLYNLSLSYMVWHKPKQQSGRNKHPFIVNCECVVLEPGTNWILDEKYISICWITLSSKGRSWMTPPSSPRPKQHDFVDQVREPQIGNFVAQQQLRSVWWTLNVKMVY